MPADENRNLLDRYIAEVWGAGDPEAVLRFAAETFKRHTSPGSAPLGRAAQIERLKGIRAAFPDITIEVEEVVSEGDKLVFRSTMRGTHQGEFLGIAPTGREVLVGLLDLVRIEDGRFAEQWGGPDMLDLLRQLGGGPGG
ncbi:MAG: ester cyclase [Acidimicrobiia bacterium]